MIFAVQALDSLRQSLVFHHYFLYRRTVCTTKYEILTKHFEYTFSLPPPPQVHMKYCWWFITLVQPNIFISWLFQFVCALVKTLGFTKYINTWFIVMLISQYCIAKNYYIWLWFGVPLVLSWTSDKHPVAWLKDWGKHKNHTLSNEKLPYGSPQAFSVPSCLLTPLW